MPSRICPSLPVTEGLWFRDSRPASREFVGRFSLTGIRGVSKLATGVWEGHTFCALLKRIPMTGEGCGDIASESGQVSCARDGTETG